MPFSMDIYAWDSFPIDTLLFWCFAAVMLISGLCVVTVKRVFHAGIAMIVCFVCAAGIYALLGCPFMAALQLLVYVGAIATMLLFAVMLTDKMMEPRPNTTFFQPFMGLFASVLLFGLLWLTVSSSKFGFAGWANSTAASSSAIDITSLSTTNIGLRLLTPYAVPFELISVIILATLIAAIALARKEDRSPADSGTPADAPASPAEPASTPAKE
ncbi:NADH-quinone oxidoreductase subunit J [bacterium]|nr:NADH-quinone oxidoreductase subunit J [bacterium]